MFTVNLCIQVVSLITLLIACGSHTAIKSSKAFLTTAVLKFMAVALRLVMVHWGDTSPMTLTVIALDVALMVICCERCSAKSRIVGMEMILAQVECRKRQRRAEGENSCGK